MDNKSMLKACKPAWLNKKIYLNKCNVVHGLVKDLKLHTVCQEAMCPNISECSSKGIATFLILGKVCTRNCSFCAVSKGVTLPVDNGEPRRVAEAVRRMRLKHVVVTSVTRDDLPDGGAKVFADTIDAIRQMDGTVTVEVLVPDFKGDRAAISTVLDAAPDIFAHNLETVPRLYPSARQMADYRRSLDVLKWAGAAADRKVKTKSGIMLGLGEREEEALGVFKDLREAGCDFLSVGQYLAPSRAHHPVVEYITPRQFEHLRACAIKMGFGHVECAPYVRSSYVASAYLK